MSIMNLPMLCCLLNFRPATLRRLSPCQSRFSAFVASLRNWRRRAVRFDWLWSLAMAPRRFVEAIVVLESPHPLIRSPSGEGTGGVFFVRFDWLWSLAMASGRFVEAIVVLEPPHPLIPSPSGEGTGGVFYVRFDWLWSLAMAPRRFVEAIVVLEPPHPLIPSPAGEGTGGVDYAASLRKSRRQAGQSDRLWSMVMGSLFVKADRRL